MTAAINFNRVSFASFLENLTLGISGGSSCLFLTSGESESRTLLKLITAESMPDEGSILLFNRQTDQINRPEIMSIRQSIGVVQSNGGLISNLKLWENIILPLRYHNIKADDKSELLARSMLKEFELDHRLMELPGHLSLFERRAAGFVRAVATSPQIMIYSGCFDTLPLKQRDSLLEKALSLHQEKPDLTSIYITSSTTALEQLRPEISCNLRHRPAEIARA